MRVNYPLDATERCQPHSASEFALQEASHNKTIVNIMLLGILECTGDTHAPSVQYVASARLQQAHSSAHLHQAVHTSSKMATTTKRIMISKPGLKRAIITLPRTIVIFLTNRQHCFQTSAVLYRDHHVFHLPLHERTLRLPLAVSKQVVLRPLTRPLKQTMHLPLAVSKQVVLCPLTRPLEQTTHLALAMSKQVVLHQLIRPPKQTMDLPLAVSKQLVPRPLIRPPKPLDFDLV
jgi:hypothetical protein